MDNKTNIETMEESLKTVGWSDDLIKAAISVSGQISPVFESTEILSVDIQLNPADTVSDQLSFTSHNYTQNIKIY